MTHRVIWWPNAQEPDVKSVIEIPETVDPFDLLAQIERRMFPKKSTTPAAEKPVPRTSSRDAAAALPRPAGVRDADLFQNPEGARVSPVESAAEQSVPVESAAGARPGGVRDTSKRAYKTLEWSGELTKQQAQILKALVESGASDMTRQELARASGVPINAVCGRVHELMNGPFAVLEEAPARACLVTKQTANPVRITKEEVVMKIKAGA